MFHDTLKRSRAVPSVSYEIRQAHPTLHPYLRQFTPKARLNATRWPSIWVSTNTPSHSIINPSRGVSAAEALTRSPDPCLFTLLRLKLLGHTADPSGRSPIRFFCYSLSTGLYGAFDFVIYAGFGYISDSVFPSSRGCGHSRLITKKPSLRCDLRKLIEVKSSFRRPGRVLHLGTGIDEPRRSAHVAGAGEVEKLRKTCNLKAPQCPFLNHALYVLIPLHLSKKAMAVGSNLPFPYHP